MRLNCWFVLVSFTLLFSFTNHLSAREVGPNGNQPDNEQTGRPARANDQEKRQSDLKRSQDDESAAPSEEDGEKQETSQKSHQASDEQDKPNIRHLKFTLDDVPKENANKIDAEQESKVASKPKETDDEEQVEDYIYIKIKTLDSEGKDDYSTEDPSAKDSPIRKTMNIRYDDEGTIKKFEQAIEKEVFGKEDGDAKDEDNSKEVMLSNIYPPLDLVKVHFKKHDNSRRPPEEEEPEPVPEELTPDQLRGKQLFEDALTKLESNQVHAFKLIDEAATLGYKEAEDFLLHGLVFGEFDFVDLDTLKQRLDYMTRKGNPLAQMVSILFLN